MPRRQRWGILTVYAWALLPNHPQPFGSGASVEATGEHRVVRPSLARPEHIVETREGGNLPRTSVASQHIDLRGAQRLLSHDSQALGEAQALYQARIREDEQVPWDQIVGLLLKSEQEGTSGWPLCYLVSKQGRDVVALACVHYAPSLEVEYGWFTYLASKKGVKGHPGLELAWQTVRHVQGSFPRPKGLLFEVDDPGEVAANKRERRARLGRIRLYATNGLLYRIGADDSFSYLQPKLSPTSIHDEVPMYLGFIPIPPTKRLKWVSRDDLTAMLNSIARLQAQLFEGRPDLGAYRAYLGHWVERLMAQIQSSCIGVEPLEVVGERAVKLLENVRASRPTPES